MTGWAVFLALLLIGALGTGACFLLGVYATYSATKWFKSRE